MTAPVPVVVCGFPKSGTTLLTSLLEGHPDLLVLPVESAVLHAPERNPGGDWEAVALRGIVERLGLLYGASAPDGPVLDEPAFVGAVRRRATAGASRSPVAFLESVVLAYGEISHQPGRRLWVEKTPLNEFHLSDALAERPEVRAIQIVRDPRATLCSFRRKRAAAGQPYRLDRFVGDWAGSVEAFDRFRALDPGAGLRVRYEDLVTAPRAEVRRVAAFLDLPWHDGLLSPTLAGSAWGGNSMYGEQFREISPSSLRRWEAEIDPLERRLLESRLGPSMERLGYTDLARGAGRRPGWFDAWRIARASDHGHRGALAAAWRLTHGFTATPCCPRARGVPSRRTGGAA